jgi:hypothetical protein
MGFFPLASLLCGEKSWVWALQVTDLDDDDSTGLDRWLYRWPLLYPRDTRPQVHS